MIQDRRRVTPRHAPLTWSLVWFTTRSITSFMPRSWHASRRSSQSCKVPYRGSIF
jgi:hypothetical protein